MADNKMELDDDLSKMYEIILNSTKGILVTCATVSLINSDTTKGDELIESVVTGLKTQWELDKPTVQEDIDKTRGKDNGDKSRIIFEDGFSKKDKLH